MALNIRINFDDAYEIEKIRTDLSFSRFFSTLKNGEKISLGIKISDETHPLMSGVHNLAFGPMVEQYKIDDEVKITHDNHSKVFSTIVLASLTFLENNKSKFLGIDGTDNARAYMYFRCILNNFDYLTSFFKIYGVNYFIRILRKDNNGDHLFDNDHIVAMPELIEKGNWISPDKLYNYFIFSLKSDEQ